MTSMTENNRNQEKISQIQGLIENENDSLDSHVLDYFEPAVTRMTSHIEWKSKYLAEYGERLQELCKDDIGIGVLEGIIDEISKIKLELRQILENSQVDDPGLDPRGHLTHYAKVINIGMVDLINRLQRIQTILNTAFTNQSRR